LTASVLDVDRYFEPTYFDVISLNGVFGWGVDQDADQNKALVSLRRIMRSGGVLLVGWDDHLTRSSIVSMAKANGFQYSNSLGLPNRVQFDVYGDGNMHVYDLFTAG